MVIRILWEGERVSKKILITAKSFREHKNEVYPLIFAKGYEILENRTGRTLTENEIIELAEKDVVGIIVGIDPLSGKVMEKCKDLKAISKYGVGMDNIDLDRAKALGISVRNAAGTNKISVAELAIALMLSLSRKIPETTARVKSGSWDRSIGMEMTGKKLGLVGCGQIGKEVAKRAKGLMMEIAVFDPFLDDECFMERYSVCRYTNLKALFSDCDILSLHIPAIPETKSIVNRESLSWMKPTAFLINTSRGELVDEAALYEALSFGKIAGAAQDVFSAEPPAAGEKLLKLDNFILTSHIGAYTREAIINMAMVSTCNLLEMIEKND